MGLSHIRLQQRVVYWSPTMETFQQGTIAWISPRQDLFALQAGSQTEFLTAAQLIYNPCAPAGDDEFQRLPAADPQHRPDQERYLRVLASAYPDHSVCSITVLEGIRTSCRTAARWRVFCQAAVLIHPHNELLLDVEGDHLWYGGVTVADLSALADKPWSPYVGVPNQWDALDVPQHELAKIVSDALDALAHHLVIPYPPAISVETGSVSRVRRVAPSQHNSLSPEKERAVAHTPENLPG
jgi:hypothetical protein